MARVVGFIAVFSSVSVFPIRFCVSADDFSLLSARSTDVVDASATLVVSSEALILLMKLSQSPRSNWIKVLTIVSYLYGDLLSWTAREYLVSESQQRIYRLHSKEFYSGVLLIILPSLDSNSNKILHTPDDSRHCWHIYMGTDNH